MERLRETAGFILIGLLLLVTVALVLYFAGNPEKHVIWLIGGAFVGSTGFIAGWTVKEVRSRPVRTIGIALAYLVLASLYWRWIYYYGLSVINVLLGGIYMVVTPFFAMWYFDREEDDE